MRVNVDKQTTFMLNAYDGSGNIICTKSVNVQMAGGNDKLNLKLEITRIADLNNVVQPAYALGQTIQYSVRLTNFEKGKDPTGSIVITDGTSTCSVTWPATTCSFQAKKTGSLTITAVYSGDNTYNKASATAPERVIDKLNTTLALSDGYKPETDKANLTALLDFPIDKTANPYQLIPTGTITFTAGSGSCDLDVMSDKLTCNGKAVEDTENGYLWTITQMLLTDPSAVSIRATYKGDDYFNTSTSNTLSFAKVNTKTAIIEAAKKGITYSDLLVALTWKDDANWVKFCSENPSDCPPLTGTIKFTTRNGTDSSGDTVTGTCVLDLAKMEVNCETNGKPDIIPEDDPDYPPDQEKGLGNVYRIIHMLLADKNADRIKAEYSGDAFYNASESTVILFTEKTIKPVLKLTKAVKSGPMLTDFDVELSWTEETEGKIPGGTLTFNIASDVCKLVFDKDNLDKKDNFSCVGSDTQITGISDIANKKITWTFTNVVLSSSSADRIKGEYGGDTLFGSAVSNIVLFEKADTKTELLSPVFKSGPNLANFTAKLSWGEAAGEEAVTGVKPGGTLTFAIGSDSCKLTFDGTTAVGETVKAKDFTCMGEFTEVKVKEVTADSITWTFEDVLLSGTDADRVKTEYSGDISFNGSASDITMFETIPTKLLIVTAVKEGDKDYLTVIADLDWSEDMDKVAGDRTPSGTVKFNVGGGNCTLDLDDESLSCEPKTGTVNVKSTEEGKSYAYEISISKMLLDDASADRISAEYSGDGYFLPSVSTKVPFTKTPTELDILNITDLNGVEQPYFVKGQQVIVTYALTSNVGGLPDPQTVKVTVGSGTCEPVSEVQDTVCTLASYEGTFTVTAKYDGDTIFEPSSDSKEITVKEKDSVTLAITSVKGPDGVEHEEYAVGDDLTVEVSVTASPITPTGDVKITLGSETCTLTLPETSCVVKAAAAADSAKVVAEYQSDTYHKMQYAEKEIKITKHALTLEIREFHNFVDIGQPYFVYDVKNDEIQDVYIYVALTGAETGHTPSGTITLRDQDGQICQITDWPAIQRCHYTPKKRLGDVQITATYNADTYYADRTVTKNLTIKDRLDTGITLTSAVKVLPDPWEKAEIIFEFNHESPVRVYAEYDYTQGGTPEYKPNYIKLKTESATCMLNLMNTTTDCGAAASRSGNVYTITGLPVGTDDSEITVSYEGNRFFYPSGEKSMALTKEEKGTTEVNISDPMHIDNSYGFVTIDFPYDEDIAEKYNVKPGGTIDIKLRTTGSSDPIHRTVNLDTDPISGNVIEFSDTGSAYRLVVGGFPLNGHVDRDISVEYSGDSYFAGSSSDWQRMERFSLSIGITSATKSMTNGINARFNVNHLSEIPSKYKYPDRIRILVNSSSTDPHYSYAPYAAAELDNPLEKEYWEVYSGGTATRDGDLFTVQNWGKTSPSNPFYEANDFWVILMDENYVYYLTSHSTLAVSTSLGMSSPSPVSLSVTIDE